MATRRAKALPVKSAARRTKKETARRQSGDRPAEERPISRLRGLLPTTPEVEEVLAQALENRPATEKARRRMADCFKLQYYFGGQWIAYRETNQGMEVLAVGSDEIRRLRQELARRREIDGVIYRYCDPW